MESSSHKNISGVELKVFNNLGSSLRLITRIFFAAVKLLSIRSVPVVGVKTNLRFGNFSIKFFGTGFETFVPIATISFLVL